MTSHYRNCFIFFLIIFGAMFLVFNSISGLAPFITAFIFAYFLAPAVDKLETWKFNRLFATTIVISLFASSFVILSLIILPMLITQITLLSEKIISQKDAIYLFIHNSFERVQDYDEGYISNNLKDALSSFTSEFANVARTILNGLLNSGRTAFNAVSLMIITPIVLFYFLRDWNNIAKTISKIFPKNLNKIANKLIAEINETLTGYIRGQSLVCFILATYYSTAFYFMGLESSFALGVTSGILVFIPYVGAIFSCTLTLLAAIIQFEEFFKPGVVLIIFIVGQFLEGNFLVPKIVGERVNLHPVWIMFGLVAGSSLMGFIGLLIALPLTAALGVIIRFAFAKYKKSSFYNN